MQQSTHRQSARIRLSWLAVVMALVTAGWLFKSQAEAQSTLNIKIASLAPEGSPWDDMLRDMDKEFNRISSGSVRLKIYAGGVLGNETQIIKKMKIGQIHAAMLTSAGLNDFDPGALTLQIPGVIQSYEELDFVMDKMRATLDARVAEKGFTTLGWGEAGWARFFTKTKVESPEDLKQLKIYAWEGDPKMTELLKKIGLKPVTIASTDMLPSLQTGLIEGVPTTALAALSYQWFGLASHMVDVKWSPLVGAVVIDNRTWNKVDPSIQPQLLEAAGKVVAKHKQTIREKDAKAIDVMKQNGLEVHPPSDPAAWQRFAESTHPLLRGEIFPADVFDAVMAAHKEYQASSH